MENKVQVQVHCIERGRLRWFGCVERCGNDCMMEKCRDIIVEGQQKR